MVYPEKTLAQGETQQKNQCIFDTSSGLEPKTHWWKVNNLTNVPTRLALAACRPV